MVNILRIINIAQYNCLGRIESAPDGLSEQNGWRAETDRLIARTIEVPAQTPGHDGPGRIEHY
uniref:Uncharacterized protein n=1 Tax=Ralstonia solanacearum TaxID=305 RepID=A0A0S4XGV3_RALSL|nr:protein of unknown function [Ralstonia solanacearum]CUV34097.1 protein of unknown function [Ralstonia solanacearum]CUV39738.1 protein of unknown function [Ralstonia solanacearum]CUV63342.1 protein of unknown function [Ralstonia solanacearum]